MKMTTSFVYDKVSAVAEQIKHKTIDPDNASVLVSDCLLVGFIWRSWSLAVMGLGNKILGNLGIWHKAAGTDEDEAIFGRRLQLACYHEMKPELAGNKKEWLNGIKV